MVNSGAPGEWAQDGAQRLPGVILIAQRPEAVLLLEGSNDLGAIRDDRHQLRLERDRSHGQGDPQPRRAGISVDAAAAASERREEHSREPGPRAERSHPSDGGW